MDIRTLTCRPDKYNLIDATLGFSTCRLTRSSDVAVIRQIQVKCDTKTTLHWSIMMPDIRITTS